MGKGKRRIGGGRGGGRGEGGGESGGILQIKILLWMCYDWFGVYYYNKYFGDWGVDIGGGGGGGGGGIQF
ncbi:Hypothetical predicted protein [Octopus vulgaris]|uniref:Uncharacterized protein n=1 Tax=Octopus vulgaris TaxID=6645 RepID=A0AA36AS38_OCTVU|nr:Hypothetical predicted protein [Octopus vulgaris]